ncbi:MAG: PLP-dependent aminotransferase family protein [Firmicutes bacterium]|nr:PLP-dependent aminotransferase family protein [Bacillota bacterium]
MARFARRIDTVADSARQLHSLTVSAAGGPIVSFGLGAPAVEAYPFDKMREISQDVFSGPEKGLDAVKYGDTLGLVPLREAVRDHLLKPRGLDIDIKNIMITAGGIQPMNFLCQLFIEPGDVILVESPSFIHGTTIFKLFEAKLEPVDMDGEGLVMEDLERKIQRFKPKMIYTIPSFHNPTGVTLSLERRVKLAELAEKYDVIVLEDDPYREIRYSGSDQPFIKQFDKSGNVILSGSFSKIFSPGSRLGFIVASDEQIAALSDVKLCTDTCTNTISQAIAAEFFKRGYYEDHRKYLCDLYRSRRDAMLKALDEYFPACAKHTVPDGGYYVWTEVPGLDMTALADEIREKLGICYGIGSGFYTEGNPEGSGRSTMRLNFSGLTEDAIDANLKKMGAFLCERLGAPCGQKG